MQRTATIAAGERKAKPNALTTKNSVYREAQCETKAVWSGLDFTSCCWRWGFCARRRIRIGACRPMPS